MISYFGDHLIFIIPGRMDRSKIFVILHHTSPPASGLRFTVEARNDTLELSNGLQGFEVKSIDILLSLLS